MDQTAFFKLSYGLYIISTTSEGKDAGCVANTLHQVTSSPAQLAVTLNKDNYTEQLIEKSGRFSAVVLTQNCGMDIIKNFGFCSSRDNDKFAQCTYRRDTHGVPYPSEHMAARYSLKVVKTLDLGTHVMFVGEVEEAEVLSEEEVMTYAAVTSMKEIRFHRTMYVRYAVHLRHCLKSCKQRQIRQLLNRSMHSHCRRAMPCS